MEFQTRDIHLRVFSEINTNKITRLNDVIERMADDIKDELEKISRSIQYKSLTYTQT